jgi:cell division inhibitor SepF
MGLFSKVTGYLGIGDDEQPTTTAATSAPRAARPAVTRRRSSGDISEIQTFDPVSYAEARSIAEVYRVGVPVIVNMAQMSEADARKLVDFMCGLKEGLEGHIKRVTAKVYLLTPNSVEVNDEDESELDGSDDLVKP